MGVVPEAPATKLEQQNVVVGETKIIEEEEEENQEQSEMERRLAALA